METEEAGSEPKLRTDSSQYRTGLKIALSWCIPTVTMVCALPVLVFLPCTDYWINNVVFQAFCSAHSVYWVSNENIFAQLWLHRMSCVLICLSGFVH